LGRDYPEIVVLTADLKHSNRLTDFARVHPDRFFNFGIAEKNMVSAAAGMAATGLLPYVATYASFIGLLCAEQIRTDVCYPQLSWLTMPGLRWVFTVPRTTPPKIWPSCARLLN
jgi:transketolase